MELKFIIPGKPKAEPRHRSTIIRGKVHSYEAIDAKNQKAFIKLLALHEMQKIDWIKSDKPIFIDITAVIAFTKTELKNKKFVEQAVNGEIYPTKKPDLDNLDKLLRDALNDLVYLDDSQIVISKSRKIYGYDAYTEVLIKEL